MADKDRQLGAKFYNSRAWRETRESYISSVNGLCERCLTKGDIVVGDIVHHKVYITNDNINDPMITLNHDNLEFLCQLHHNQEHKSSGEVVRDGLMFDEEGNLVME